MDWAHSNKRLGGYRWFWLKLCALAHGCNTQHQAKPWEVSEFGVVPCSECSSGRFAQHGASSGPKCDQKPQPDPSMPVLGEDGCKQLLWMHLTHPAWRDPCIASAFRHLPMNVADVGGATDIPDLLPILKHHGGDNSTPGHAGFRRPTCVGDGTQVLSNFPPLTTGRRCSALGKYQYLAGGAQKLNGAKTGSKTKPVSLIKLLAQEEETWVVTFPWGLRLYITITTVKEVQSFPGRWEVGVWLHHRLTGPSGRLDIYTALQHSPINHCMLRWTFTYHFQAKTSLNRKPRQLWFGETP